MNKPISAQLQEFDNYVGSLFPKEDTERLKILCQKGSEALLGYDHVDVLGALAGLKTGDPLLEKLRMPYILLSSHYLLLDDVIDRHLAKEEDALYSSHLLLMAYSEIFLSLNANAAERTKLDLVKRMANRVFENAFAVRQEIKQRTGEYRPNKDENYQMIAGRSNSTIQFYEILCLLTGKTPDENIIYLLTELIYYLQLGDDLGDWNKDFKHGNFTPLIQECFLHLPAEKRSDISSIETVLYTGGVYEKYVAQIVNNLDKIKNEFMELNGINTQPICDWIDGARSKAYYLLSNMVTKKLALLKNI